MATKVQLEARRAALLTHLRERCEDPAASGRLLPSCDELAREHGISRSYAHTIVKTLEREGLIYSVPRSGIYIGRRRPAASELYLFLTSVRMRQEAISCQIQEGFSERVAELGGAMITIYDDDLNIDVNWLSAHSIAGLSSDSIRGSQDHWIFQVPGMSDVPTVLYHTDAEVHVHSDLVTFDDVAGARQATDHLIQLGHRRIAFIAGHTEDSEYRPAWSVNRECGWREALGDAGITPGPVLYFQGHPDFEATMWGKPHMTATVRRIAAPLLANRDITAVIAVNDAHAMGLIQALSDANVPHDDWPSIVGFDDDQEARDYLLTSVRLPWADLGRTAAQMIWDRRRGVLAGLSKHRTVPMRLMVRLSSTTGWPAVIRNRAPSKTKPHDDRVVPALLAAP
jgi:DNA-binding LacI/PurR family transcriptional regulator